MGDGTRGSHGVISEEHVEETTAAFLATHENCPQQMVEFHRGGWSLVCWCRWCSDLKTHEVRGEP